MGHSQLSQFVNNFLDCRSVLIEGGGGVPDVDHEVLVAEVQWVRRVVRDKGEVQQLTGAPLGREVAKREFDDDEPGGSQPVPNGRVHVVGYDSHAFRKDRLSVGFEKSLRGL